MLRPSARSLAFLVTLATAATLGSLSGCRTQEERPSGAPSAVASADPQFVAAPAATPVGSQVCESCHTKEFAAWKGSDHARSMAKAEGGAVLGQPAKSPARNHEPAYAVRRDGEELIVRTEGEAGSTDYPVRFTFGHFPLQQYLVDGERGRLQPLRLSWDSRPKDAGGQRYFHLYAGTSIPVGDPLHFLGPNQNYQGMCGECHSTGYRRGYDAKADSFATHYDEITVACEACHGPGSNHVAWAREKKNYPARGLTHELRGASALSFFPSAAATTAAPDHVEAGLAPNELDVCATCHARRVILDEDPWPGMAFLDRALPAFPVPPLYHGDGRMLDEVYNYGSFLQSKMSHRGVTCSHCHDPHQGTRKAEGEAVCGSCHRLEHYRAEAHTRHEAGKASCIDCHMPSRLYMGVDRRHDHSFRVPRPDLALLEEGPEKGNSVCTDCHDDESAEWASAAWARLWPSAKRPSSDELRLRARRGDQAVFAPLLARARDPGQPLLVRASCLLEAAPLPGSRTELLAVVRSLQGSSEDLLRLAAVTVAPHLPREAALDVWRRGLGDPRFSVRFAAMQDLVAGVARSERTALDGALGRVVAEYMKKSAPFLDRAEVRTTRGLLALGQGQPEAAGREFEAALRVDPNSVPALVNWAEVERQAGRDAAALARVEERLKTLPDAAPLQYTRGMILVRAQQKAEALKALAKAAELEPNQVDYQIAHVVALYDQRGRAAALAALGEALLRAPNEPRYLGLQRKLAR